MQIIYVTDILNFDFSISIVGDTDINMPRPKYHLE